MYKILKKELKQFHPFSHFLATAAEVFNKPDNNYEISIKAFKSF